MKDWQNKKIKILLGKWLHVHLLVHPSGAHLLSATLIKATSGIPFFSDGVA